MKLFKRFLSMVLSMLLLSSLFAVPTMATSFDFSDLTVGTDGKIPSTLSNENTYSVYNGVDYVDDATAYRQVYLADNAAGDKEIILKSTSNHNYFGFSINKTEQMSGIIEIGCKLKIDDLLATRTFGSHESSEYNNKWLMKVAATSGYMYVVGKGLSVRAAAGDILDATFRINLSTGESRAIVKKNGLSWIDETNTYADYVDGTWSLTNAYKRIYMYQHGYKGTDLAPAVSHWSNIYMKSIDSLASTEISYDFDDLAASVGSEYSGESGKITVTDDKVFLAADDNGGKRLKMTSTGDVYAGYITINNPEQFAGLLELGFDLEMSDLNAYRLFGGNDCWHGSTGMDYLMRIVAADGRIMLNSGAYDTVAERKYVEAGDKLNFKFWLDTDTGWLRTRVLKNGELFLDKIIESCTAYEKWLSTDGYLENMKLYHTDGTAGTDAVSYFDNYYIKKCADAKNLLSIDEGLSIANNIASFKASTKHDYIGKLMLVIAEYSDIDGTEELKALKVGNIDVSGESDIYSAEISPSGEDNTTLRAFLWNAETLAPIATPASAAPTPAP